MHKSVLRFVCGSAVLLAAGVLGAAVSSAADDPVYARHCVACHQPEGAGMPGIAPSLHSEPLKNIKPDASVYVVQVLLNGMQGAATDSFYAGVMPPWNFLSDAELAAVASYVLKLNGQDAAITPEQVAEQRKAAMGRAELKALRSAH